eukprot:2507303-Lingulodinium_polyedra.AAC.1
MALWPRPCHPVGPGDSPFSFKLQCAACSALSHRHSPRSEEAEDVDAAGRQRAQPPVVERQHCSRQRGQLR